MTLNDNSWSTLVAAGLLSLGMGALVIAYPSPSLKTLGILLGVYLLLGGIALLVRAFSKDAEPGSAGLFIGVMALISGIVVIKQPGGSLVAVTLCVGILLVVAGAVDLSQGVVHAEERALKVVRGALLIAGGTVILSVPKMSVGTLASLVGITICLQGAIQVWQGVQLRAQRTPG